MHALASLYLWLLSRPSLSRRVGRWAEIRPPAPLLRAAIAAYVRFYRVDLGEAAEPVASFRTFDEFFTRRLREGARPVAAAPDVIVAPCDARLHGLGRVPDDRRLEQIKGKSFGLEELLGDAPLAAKFGGGRHAILYLSPAMYHRVHWPVDGRVVGWRRIPGRLYPVNRLAIRHVDRLFAVNQRVVVEVDSDACGPMAVVLVGATNVGRISLTFEGLGVSPSIAGGWTTPTKAVETRRGEELGTFHLGSTVVLLASEPALASAGPADGDLVKMGQALWRRA
jgi:phosphatidylserine decarboxylase